MAFRFSTGDEFWSKMFHLLSGLFFMFLFLKIDELGVWVTMATVIALTVTTSFMLVFQKDSSVE